MIGNRRLWSLVYADDLVLLAKNRKALLLMLNMLKGIFKQMKLILSKEKTKVLVFKKDKNSKKEK